MTIRVTGGQAVAFAVALAAMILLAVVNGVQASYLFIFDPLKRQSAARCEMLESHIANPVHLCRACEEGRSLISVVGYPEYINPDWNPRLSDDMQVDSRGIITRTEGYRIGQYRRDSYRPPRRNIIHGAGLGFGRGKPDGMGGGAKSDPD